MTKTDLIPTAIWCRADQHDLLRTVAERANLSPVVFGGPEPCALPDWTTRANASPATTTDLRHLSETTDAAALLIADPGSFAEGADQGDLRTVLRAAQRGVSVLCFEPIPSLGLRLSDPAWREASEAAHQGVMTVPLIRRGAMARQLQDMLEGFGPIETVALHALCSSGEGSLGVRLYESCDWLHSILGVPIGIDAGHVASPLGEPSPETLRGLSGHMSAVLRFEDGQTATLLASDQAASWARSLTLIGPGGRVDATDRQLLWTDASGSVVESIATGITGDDLAASVIADDIAAALGRSPRMIPVDRHAVLAMSHAAILSSKTGHAENPREILRIAGGG